MEGTMWRPMRTTYLVRLVVAGDRGVWLSDSEGILAEFDDEDVAAAFVRSLLVGPQRDCLCRLGRAVAEELDMARFQVRLDLVERTERMSVMEDTEEGLVDWVDTDDEIVSSVVVMRPEPESAADESWEPVDAWASVEWLHA